MADTFLTIGKMYNEFAWAYNKPFPGKGNMILNMDKSQK